MSFQTKSLRNNPGRKNLPTLNLSTDSSTINNHNNVSQTGHLSVKTLKRKNLRGLSLGGNDNSGPSKDGLSLAIPISNHKRKSIQQVTTSSTPIDTVTSTTLEAAMNKLDLKQDSEYTGATKPQIITTKITTSSITPDGSLAGNDGFCLNDFKESDLLRLEDLGAGNSGSVLKVIHTPSKKTMAKKTIHIENNQDVKRQIARELKIMNECKSKYIIEFYGSFLQEGNVIICMEYMDIGSLDKVLKISGPFPEFFINHVAYSVLNGLKYLYTQHKIIHRDIKPSNVLLNSKGTLKLCDFGVSRELIGSVADTFVGTSTYMSPERILGAKYTIKGDIWSLGLMLVELATGFFPFGDNENIAPAGILDLLQRIVNEPPPSLRDFNEKYFAANNIDPKSIPERRLYPSQQDMNGNSCSSALAANSESNEISMRKSKPYYPFSERFSNFVDECLIKEESQRPSPTELLKDIFILVYKKDITPEGSKDLKSDIKEWCKNVKKMKKN
ncbi:mitogen-activated protein kinase kinase [Saccharomycopsis crataegensis]|uniref:Mitogen-activated protein kinase kinase n=1 Tax=Saccharomycopsis crataegensis TaxID=43959 RepID=A0AAV5QPZ1_9ASCO|nr:mitogen-activated protein kinase kinase [Saccharomycopsis crataegensis]